MRLPLKMAKKLHLVQNAEATLLLKAGSFHLHAKSSALAACLFQRTILSEVIHSLHRACLTAGIPTPCLHMNFKHCDMVEQGLGRYLCIVRSLKLPNLFVTCGGGSLV